MKLEHDNKAFKARVHSLFKKLKDEKKTITPPIIYIFAANKFIGHMRVVSISGLENKDEIKRLAKWRKQSEIWFPSQFKVTLSGTKKWLKERLLNTDDRILFIIESPSGKPIGHVGLYRFDFKKKSCEIDNVIRGEEGIPGIMTYSITELIKWTNKYLKPRTIYLEVFSDNEKAIKLYNRCGFKEVKRIPIKKEIHNSIVTWVEKPGEKGDKYTVYMKLS